MDNFLWNNEIFLRPFVFGQILNLYFSKKNYFHHQNCSFEILPPVKNLHAWTYLLNKHVNSAVAIYVLNVLTIVINVLHYALCVQDGTHWLGLIPAVGPLLDWLQFLFFYVFLLDWYLRDNCNVVVFYVHIFHG